MIDVVIIGQNEGIHVVDMYNSLREYPYSRVWVADRCTDNSVAIVRELGEKQITTPTNLVGRQTSFARNLGLLLCDSKNDVLFLDGDRYVTHGTLKFLEEAKTDVSLLLLEDDFREDIDFEYCYGRVTNFFYSCGVFFKREAINKIVNFQNGELFSTDIQDVWGIEDTYLGDVCYHLGLTAAIYKNCRLRGSFDRRNIDSIHVLERRFRKREKLNVLWD